MHNSLENSYEKIVLSMSAHTPFHTEFIQKKWTPTMPYVDIDSLTSVYSKSDHCSHNTN